MTTKPNCYELVARQTESTVTYRIESNDISDAEIKKLISTKEHYHCGIASVNRHNGMVDVRVFK